MSHDIKTAIYKVDLFKPASSSGYSIDAFYHHSNELAEYSPDVLEQELNSMLKEGHLRQKNNEKYYWATREGKVASRKHLARNGVLFKALVDQKSYPLCDLILAILASDHISPFSGSDSFSLEEIAIYLHEFSTEELTKAKLELEGAELIREEDLFAVEPIYITGRGLRIYKAESRFKLGLGSNEGVLSLIEPCPRDARFDRLGFDKDLQQNLEKRWLEMEACATGAAYLAAVILLGSILEGALWAKLNANIQAAMTAKKAPKDKRGSVRALDAWTLADYIAVSTELGFVPKSIEKHSHELRDTRNLVHPRKQVSEQIAVDGSLYRISRQIAEAVMDALSS